MPATLVFYRATNSEKRPEYFGAVTSGPPHAVHYQVQANEDRTLNWRLWRVEALDAEAFNRLHETHPPYEAPRPIDQVEFLRLLKEYVLPPLPL